MNAKTNAIKSVCEAPTLSESLKNFRNNENLLENCKFIFTKEGEPNIPEHVRQRTFSNGFGIFNILLSDSIFVLDSEILNGMVKDGTVNYTIDSSVALDSMAVSYLRRYLNNQENRIPKEFKEIFEYLVQSKVNIDPMPYMMENIKNVGDQSKVASILEILKSYEILKNIDRDKWFEEGIIQSKSSIEQIEENAKIYLEQMLNISKDNNTLKYINDIYNLRYCLLLKIVLIQLSNPQRNIEAKLEELLEFCHNSIGVLPLREIVIAKEYFKRGQNLKFFGKIQKGNKKLITTIKNMTWDIYHIVSMEKNIPHFPSEGDYFIPAFLTFDKRLIEILNLYHIKSIGFSKESNEIYPLFDANEFYTEINGKPNLEFYFSEEAKINREKNLQLKTNLQLKKNIESLINILENKLLEYS
ncbi:hypothetical protein [Peribacillus frigoritolerans]|uniref:hypothetical protein n=1 Tax=Peribacillus frigoritolerans TaxID=450367 RepID=UPI0039A38041